MFGGHVACGLTGLLEKGTDLTVDGLRFDHPFDGDWVVLEDGYQTLLDEGLVDAIGVFDKEIHPP